MGTIKQGVLGQFSGKVGPVVGASWKGIGYMRGLPQKVHDANTNKQKDQRQKFSLIQSFIKAVNAFLRIGFKNYADKMSTANAAFKYNIKNAIQGTWPNQTLDFPNVRVAQGDLPGALNQVAASTVAGTVLFTWDDNSGEIGASGIDKNLLLVFNPQKNVAAAFEALGERADGTQSVTVPDSWSGDLVHCYLAFETEDTFIQSNSAYAGAVTVA